MKLIMIRVLRRLGCFRQISFASFWVIMNIMGFSPESMQHSFLEFFTAVPAGHS